MKRLLFVLSIVGAPWLCASSANAQPSSTEGPSPPGAQGMTLQAFQSHQRDRMMRMDADHDGRISLAEWTAWRTAHPGRGGGDDPAHGFARMDLNQDGYITPDEIDAASARRFARMDANHDGVATPDERGPAMRGGGDEPAQPSPPPQ